MLSRWHAAVAARSARIASGSWSPSSSGSDSTANSPTRAAAFLMRPRFAGARLRRLLIVLLSILLISICMVRLSEQHGLAVPDGIRHLPWGVSVDKAPISEKKRPVDEPKESEEVATDATTRLPHIPAKIWQVYLDFKPSAVSMTYMASWLLHSPSYSYTLLDKGGALGMVTRLVDMATAQGGKWRVPMYPDTFRQSTAPKKANGGEEDDADEKPEPVPVSMEMADLTFAEDAVQQYSAMPRRVLRADFLRYLILALEGGVYSDIDTQLVKDIRDWVPAQFRADTRLIVGLEADSSPPVHGTTYEVQFCQWTLASSPDHPTMWTMLDRILKKVRKIKGGITGPKLTDKDVLEITGPAAWTEVVFEHLNQVAGTGVGEAHITWETLTGMKEPRLYGDTLVLPIDGFATGVPHSHASQSKSEQTLVKHQFQGQWRDDKG
ncbi:hypothetical protein SEUCBS139899_000990 [Sporothrix eucalyptigena]